jgi:hypothetical protein
MKNQIIKNKIDFFIEFLKSIGTKENNNITINENHYKQAIYNNKIQPFIASLEPHYYDSKKKYLQKYITYNGFITILRQISNKNEIIYTSKIKYTKSVHYIEYYFCVDNI